MGKKSKLNANVQMRFDEGTHDDAGAGGGGEGVQCMHAVVVSDGGEQGPAQVSIEDSLLLHARAAALRCGPHAQVGASGLSCALFSSLLIVTSMPRNLDLPRASILLLAGLRVNDKHGGALTGRAGARVLEQASLGDTIVQDSAALLDAQNAQKARVSLVNTTILRVPLVCAQTDVLAASAAGDGGQEVGWQYKPRRLHFERSWT